MGEWSCEVTAATFQLGKYGTELSSKSRGTIHLTGKHPDDPVRIDANYLGDPQDLKDLATGLSMARAIGNSVPLRPFTRREVAPGPISGAELERFFRDGLGTFWHQSGTAKMGHDEMSVVDGQLKVYGVDRLRIADASILPRVTTGNTMAPCVVIGEQAARFLQNERYEAEASESRAYEEATR